MTRFIVLRASTDSCSGRIEAIRREAIVLRTRGRLQWQSEAYCWRYLMGVLLSLLPRSVANKDRLLTYCVVNR